MICQSFRLIRLFSFNLFTVIGFGTRIWLCGFCTFERYTFSRYFGRIFCQSMIWFKPSLCYLYNYTISYLPPSPNCLSTIVKNGAWYHAAPGCYIRIPFPHSNSFFPLGAGNSSATLLIAPLLVYSRRAPEISKQDKMNIKQQNLLPLPRSGQISDSPSRPLLIAGLCPNDQEGPESCWVSLESLASLDLDS